MKTFLALCLIFGTVVADWKVLTPAEVIEIRKECFQSEKVSEANIAKIKDRMYPDEESVRCYVRCMMVKMDMWDDTNGYNLDRVDAQLRKLGNNVTKDNLTKCIRENTDNVDSCTWAYKGLTCLYDNHQITATPLEHS